MKVKASLSSYHILASRQIPKLLDGYIISLTILESYIFSKLYNTLFGYEKNLTIT